MTDGPPIQDVSASLSVQAVFYSIPGAGRTSFLGSGGDKYKVLIIRPPVDHTDAIVGSGVKEWVVDNWQVMLEDVVEYLQHEGHKWDIVAWDSVSLFQDVGLDDIWQAVIDRRPDRKWGPRDKGEYGLNMDRIKEWTRIVSGLSSAGNFHFFITAHREELWHEDSQTDLYKPWVQGKQMSDKIMGYMNMVGYMEVRKNGRRRLRFNATSEFYAKDQFDAFENGRLDLPKGGPNLVTFMEAVEAARARKLAEEAATKKKSKSKRSSKSRKTSGTRGRKVRERNS